MKILFERPAVSYHEALPLGNGRMGAMIYGELMREQIVLNESSLWSGSPQDSDREGAAEYLPKIRKLLAEGQEWEAQALFQQHFTCKGAGSNYAHGSTVPFGCYQTLGRLQLSWFQAVSSGRVGCDCAEQYRRELDLTTGEARVTFRTFGVGFERMYTALQDQKGILIRLRADQPGMIHFSAGLDRDEHFVTEAAGTHAVWMHGQLDDGFGTDQGVRYACAVTVRTKGGQVRTEGCRVYVQDADEAYLAITAETDMSGFMGKKANADLKTTVLETGEAILKENMDNLISENRKALAKIMDSMEISFASEGSAAELTTPERLKRFIQGDEDPELLALYVQYARYLLHASSREGGFAANLQGIWADEIQTPWNGDWHLNAQQMIYWLAEKANLSRDHIPYIKLTEELVEPGKKTAETYYHARGWLAHTCTNPWGFTSPLEDASWGSTTGSPAWQCHHLWEHYLYTLDREYLEEVYPVMKEAALFYLDMLVENQEKGWLVTSPSSSPENTYLDDKGRVCALCEGPAYDRELVYSLFDNCLQAQYVLQSDPEIARQMEETIPRLAPVEIGLDGRIMEWGKEYREAAPYHRHVSHLWGVYPGQMVQPEKNRDLALAAYRSLQARGRTTVGWAIAYRMCLYARLGRAKESYSFVQDMFRYATSPNLFNLAYHCDETEKDPRLPDWDACRYPFQIDGNQGNAAGILLMLEDDFARVREDGEMETEIFLLPALPKQLKTGKIRGLCTKGGFTVDMEWKNQRVIRARISGREGASCLLHMNGKIYSIQLEKSSVEVKENDS